MSCQMRSRRTLTHWSRSAAFSRTTRAWWAATAAKIGMKCVVIQESWVPHEDAVYDRVGNILRTRLMGADSRIVPDGFDIGIRKSWEEAIQSVKDAGGKPYGIPAGASVHKYGGLGYVGFAEEVRAQEAQMG